MPAIITTERLLLRELELDDVDALFEILGDPTAMRYYPAPFNRDGVAGWIDRARRSYVENGFGLWAVIRRSDGRFLGDCGPMLQPVEGQLIPEVGYHIVTSEQGRGYATEAARACVAWVFADTRFDVVCSLVSPANAPSRAVAAKVHTAMREFMWANHDKEMCLYWTERPDSLSDPASGVMGPTLPRMRALPEVFETDALIDPLADGWDLDVETIEYAPVGSLADLASFTNVLRSAHRENDDMQTASDQLGKCVAIRDQWAMRLA